MTPYEIALQKVKDKLVRKAKRKQKRNGVLKPRKEIVVKIKSEDADEIFSVWIRNRDKRCVKCGATEGLTNSHYWSRVHSATRYDPENCDALCWAPCHTTVEHEKQGWYMAFKIKQLGQERYDALTQRAMSIMKRDDAIEQVLKLMESSKI